MKKVLALVLALVLAFGVMTCGASAEAADYSDELYIMNVFVNNVEYWFPVYAGMKEACKLLGVNCEYSGTTEYDTQKQVESFNADVAKGPKGMVLSPIEEAAFVEPINAAIAQGISVVTYASDSPESNRCAYVTSDNVNEGQSAARQLCEEVGSGSILVLRNPNQDNHNRRCDAFIAYVEANYPDCKVVADIPTEQDSQRGYDAVMTTYQNNPDLVGVFSPEGSSITGAATAAAELNATGANIRCCCVDTSDVLLEMLAADQMFMLLCPDQFTQGWVSMMLCFGNAHPEVYVPMNERRGGVGETLMSVTVDNGLTQVTKDTAEYYYCAQYAKDLGYKDVADMLSPYTVG